MSHDHKREYTPQRLDEIVHSLQGTCQSLEDALSEEDDEDESDIQLTDYIDQEIFLCPVCNWWCERSEGNEDPAQDEDVCDDCFEGEKE